jgi:hypothetical protein
LKKKTREREYDSQVSRVLKLEYVEDASWSERSIKVTSTLEVAILNNVQAERHVQKKTIDILKYEHEVTSSTILRVLKRNEF